MKIDDLNFSVRTYNCLKRAKIDTIEQLLKKSDDDLMGIRCFGVGCLKEVHEKIRRPSIPSPKEDNPNIMELCFHNGEQHMKEKIIAQFQSVAGAMPCIPIAQAIKMVEEL